MKTQRLDMIAHMVTENQMVKASELSEKFHVSMETIRRDLEHLEKEGLVKRTHGGAVLNYQGRDEPDFNYREVKNYEEKLRIGQKAASFVEDGDSVIIDIGTTAMAMTQFLMGKHITVFTNSITVARRLMDDENIKVFLLGGCVRGGEGTTSGSNAEGEIDQVYVNKLFLGAGALEPECGIMDYIDEEASLRRHFIKHSRKVYAIADHSKFGLQALHKVCGLEDVDILITDEHTDKRMIREIRDKGVEVYIA